MQFCIFFFFVTWSTCSLLKLKIRLTMNPRNFITLMLPCKTYTKINLLCFFLSFNNNVFALNLNEQITSLMKAGAMPKRSAFVRLNLLKKYVIRFYQHHNNLKELNNWSNAWYDEFVKKGQHPQGERMSIICT